MDSLALRVLQPSYSLLKLATPHSQSKLPWKFKKSTHSWSLAVLILSYAGLLTYRWSLQFHFPQWISFNVIYLHSPRSMSSTHFVSLLQGGCRPVQSLTSHTDDFWIISASKFALINQCGGVRRVLAFNVQLDRRVVALAARRWMFLSVSKFLREISFEVALSTVDVALQECSLDISRHE